MNLPPRICFEHGKSRIHMRMWWFTVGVSAVWISVHTLIKDQSPLKDNDGVTIIPKQFDIGIMLPCYLPFRLAMDNIINTIVEIEIINAKQPDPAPGKKIIYIERVFTSLLVPVLIEFFEAHRAWLRDTFGTIDKWPPIFDFARVIRNALGHGGNLDIRDLKKDVQWHHIRYGAKDHGRKILENELRVGDLLLLLIDLSNELDRLGCPPM